MKRLVMAVVACVSLVLPLFGAPVSVQSPDGQISLSIQEKAGELFYSIQQGGNPLIAPSSIEIVSGATMSVVKHSIRESDSTWSPTWGQFSQNRDHYRELSLSLKSNEIPVTLLCRVYDAGVGLRFVLAKGSKGEKMAISRMASTPAAISDRSIFVRSRGLNILRLTTTGLPLPRMDR